MENFPSVQAVTIKKQTAAARRLSSTKKRVLKPVLHSGHAVDEAHKGIIATAVASPTAAMDITEFCPDPIKIKISMLRCVDRDSIGVITDVVRSMFIVIIKSFRYLLVKSRRLVVAARFIRKWWRFVDKQLQQQMSALISAWEGEEEVKRQEQRAAGRSLLSRKSKNCLETFVPTELKKEVLVHYRDECKAKFKKEYSRWVAGRRAGPPPRHNWFVTVKRMPIDVLVKMAELIDRKNAVDRVDKVLSIPDERRASVHQEHRGSTVNLDNPRLSVQNVALTPTTKDVTNQPRTLRKASVAPLTGPLTPLETAEAFAKPPKFLMDPSKRKSIASSSNSNNAPLINMDFAIVVTDVLENSRATEQTNQSIMSPSSGSKSMSKSKKKKMELDVLPRIPPPRGIDITSMEVLRKFCPGTIPSWSHEYRGLGERSNFCDVGRMDPFCRS
eukprot:PhF_6_TR27803/c0_g1_i2/m.40507